MQAQFSDPVQLAQALIRCPSVTPAEAGALTLMQQVLTESGFSCHRLPFSGAGTPDVDNLYARIGTTGPHLCFAGHTDVVPVGDPEKWTSPPFAAEIRDETLYGRGAVDMKGAIACFAVAAHRHLQQRNGLAHGSISLLLTGDEEGPAINGTVKVLEWLAANGQQIDAAVVGEPSNPDALGDEIKIGRRGSLNGEIIVAGKQGHAAYQKLADNPVPKLARIIDRLYAEPLDQGTAHFEPSNLEVTVLSVPNAVTNVIPGEARAGFNVRFNDTFTRASLEHWVRARVNAAAREVSADVSLGFSGNANAFVTEPGPLVEAMRSAIRDVTGRTAALSTAGGTSDARFIKDHCPVLEFGLINRSAHHTDEHVAVADLIQLAAIYERFLERFFVRPGDG